MTGWAYISSVDITAARFVRAITRHDQEGLEACFEPDARFRALIPSGLHEYDDAASAAAVVSGWFADAELELLAESSDTVGDRLHLSYRFAGTEEGSRFVVEQHVFARLSGGRIAAADLMCSGFRPPA